MTIPSFPTVIYLDGVKVGHVKELHLHVVSDQLSWCGELITDKMTRAILLEDIKIDFREGIPCATVHLAVRPEGKQA